MTVLMIVCKVSEYIDGDKLLENFQHDNFMILTSWHMLNILCQKGY